MQTIAFTAHSKKAALEKVLQRLTQRNVIEVETRSIVPDWAVKRAPSPQRKQEFGRCTFGELPPLRPARKRLRLPPVALATYVDLIEQGMWESTSRRIVARICQSTPQSLPLDGRHFDKLLAQLVVEEIMTAAPLQVVPGKRRVVAVMGRKGAGTTTTVAKLATRYRLREKRQVAIVAVDQKKHSDDMLQRYADAIALPLHAVNGPSALQATLQQLPEAELVLVDVQADERQGQPYERQCLKLLSDGLIDEVHGVVDCNDSLQRVAASSARWAQLGMTAVIPTRIDQVSERGRLFEVFRQVQLPVSYFADGENVVRDLHTADADKLAQLVMNGRAYA